MTNTLFINRSTSISENQIDAVLQLLEKDATVPFIARYRKEATGGLDEVEIAKIRDILKQYDDLQSRKTVVLNSIDEQGKLSDLLRDKIANCYAPKDLEDLYLPFKPKRKNRADEARKLGLEPLAKLIISQRGIDPNEAAEKYTNAKLTEIADVLSGARDIIAEWINENMHLRKRLRNLFEKRVIFSSELIKGKEQTGEVYKDYFKHEEKLRYCPSHRFLAIMRAEKEGIIKIKALPPREEALQIISEAIIKGIGKDADEVLKAGKDAYTRLLAPSLENEALADAREKADIESIQVFSKNLRQLLLAPPLGASRVLAIDPGFRSGCKVVCLNEQGDLLHNETVYPHPPQNEKSKASSKISQLISSYKIDTVAIGDGTAGRETEELIKRIRFNSDVRVFVVREDGASIYSASPIARKEFPQHDITVRGAISIGRRLTDPLSELVKIDPKSLGVGQYQHDVDQKKLKASLDDVVISAVNNVGVDLNTASPYLLQYVSGLSLSTAEKIVQFRSEKGRFKSREDLLKIPRFGAKTFEQAAGFLRIRLGENPLDNTAVHPESYALVKKLAKSRNTTLVELLGNEILLSQIEQDQELSYTEKDIIQELKKPGRDPRKQVKVLNFSKLIRTIDDLSVGQILPGIVTNVTNFGAFVNIGIKENGLIHKSHLSDEYVDNPADHIALHEHVEVEIMTIDKERKRIGLKKK